MRPTSCRVRRPSYRAGICRSFRARPGFDISLWRSSSATLMGRVRRRGAERLCLRRRQRCGRRSTTFRGHGGDILISFGGQAGRELALNCETPEALAAQYQAVIDKYKLAVLDMDIEGTAVKDAASVDRRNAALALIQGANPGVQVSYTLPVATTGLVPSGIALLNNAMSRGVKVAVVNIMTMDYGGSADPQKGSACHQRGERDDRADAG